MKINYLYIVCCVRGYSSIQTQSPREWLTLLSNIKIAKHLLGIEIGDKVRDKIICCGSVVSTASISHPFLIDIRYLPIGQTCSLSILFEKFVLSQISSHHRYFPSKLSNNDTKVPRSSDLAFRCLISHNGVLKYSLSAATAE